jgi:hypothetical protein
MYIIKVIFCVFAITDVIYSEIKKDLQIFAIHFGWLWFVSCTTRSYSLRWKSVMPWSVYHIEWRVTMPGYTSLVKSQPSVPTQDNIYRQGKNVKQSISRSEQALRFPGGTGSHISRQFAHKRGKVFGPTQRPPLPPGNIPSTHFSQCVLGWVETRTTTVRHHRESNPRPSGL